MDEPDFEIPLIEEFKCPICWGPLVEPIQTLCGHHFCNDCINKSIRLRRECPVDKKKLLIFFQMPV